MFMLKRNRELRQRLKEYLSAGLKTIDSFKEGLHHYCAHGLEGLDAFAAATDRDESACDQLRRTIELELFSKSLMPESREDIMVLLEHVDLVMNDVDGLEILARAKAALPNCEVILMTGHGSIPSAVSAMQQGAFNYLLKPLKLDQLRVIAQRAGESALHT